MVLVQRYAFVGPKFTVDYGNDVPTQDDRYCNVFNDDGIQIDVFKYEETQEASGARFESFKEFLKSVLNHQIFEAVGAGKFGAGKFDVGPLINPTNEYLAMCDVQKILDGLMDEICAYNSTVEQHKASLLRAIVNARDNSVIINYELPHNQRFFERLCEAGEKIGFVVSKTLPQDIMTVYGKSRPDVSIYRDEGRFISGKAVTGAILSEQSYSVISGGAIELKNYEVHHKNIESPEVAQAVANMIKLAGFLCLKALKKGVIVEKITIFGLLVSHKSRYCIPLKYTSMCNSDVTTVMVGDEILLPKALDNLFHCI